MAGIIKKQILKHLSRFTKNLSPDKINLSTLKGEGQLTNLELDEEVLQNMLDLPTWLAITKVFCNKASIRIQWTKLKTHPICLFLDKVEVEMRTCEDPRPPNGQSPIALAAGQSEYGFAEKVVEGMFVVVNSITIQIHAKAFHASFELWQLQGYSVNPRWQQSDLRFTRVTDPQRGEVLTFKELTWQTLRIEADATDSGDPDAVSTPLRLITNQGKIQIALKRKTKDCNVVASKLMFLLDDLLWVLTDSQLKAMMKYAKSLSEAMEKSAQQRKSMAPEPTQVTPPAASAQQTWSQTFSGSQSTSSAGQYFDKYDMKESSYHLLISRLDLHICDDSQAQETGAAKQRVRNGAIQLTFRKMGFDYYPFHLAGDSCAHWTQHCPAMETRAEWAAALESQFQKNADALFDELDSERLQSNKSPLKRRPETLSTSRSSEPEVGLQKMAKPSRPVWSRLRSSCVVVRVDGLNLHQVSSAAQRTKKPVPLLSCNKKYQKLPERVYAIHLQFTEYYFPDSHGFPVPSPNLYLQLNNLTLTVDPTSLLWLNIFCLDLYRSLQQFKEIYKLQDLGKSDEHVAMRLDTTGLKLTIPVEKKMADHPDRPQCLSVCMSRMTATNTRHVAHCGCTDLQTLFRNFAACEFFHATFSRFPKSADSFGLLHSLFMRHAYPVDPGFGNDRGTIHEALKTRASEDLWSVHFSEISLQFEGSESSKGKPLCFIVAFPLSIWACLPNRYKQAQESRQLPKTSSTPLRPSLSYDSSVRSTEGEAQLGQRSKSEQNFENVFLNSQAGELSQGSRGSLTDSATDTNELEASADVHILMHSTAHVKIRLNHYQYLVLLRMKEELQELQELLTEDTQTLMGPSAQPQTSCMGVLFSSAEIALLLPPVLNSEPGHHSPDSETTSFLESELSHAESREALASDSKGSKWDGSLDVPANHIEGSDLVHVDDKTEGMDSGVLLNSNCEDNNSDLCTDGLGGLDEAHEAVEGFQAKRCDLPSSPSMALHPLNSRDPSMSGQDIISMKNLETELTSALNMTKDATKEAISVTMDLTKEAVSLTKDVFSFSKGKMSSLQKLQSRNQVLKGDEMVLASTVSSSSRMRFFSAKRTSSQQSFDTASLDGSVSAAEDGISIDSDGSEGFVLLAESEPSLDPGAAGEIGSRYSPVSSRDGGREAGQEETASPDLNSSASQSGDEADQSVVSVLVLKMHDVNCFIEARGDDLAVAVQAAEVMPEHLGNVGLQDFMQSNEGEGDTSSQKSSPSRDLGQREPAVCLRFEAGPGAARLSTLAALNGFLHFQIRRYSAELMISSLTHLAPFLEDELPPDVIPMKIEIVDTQITLKDDGPRIYLSSPGPIPVTLAVDHISVVRKDDGVFYITAAPPTNLQKAVEGATLPPAASTAMQPAETAVHLSQPTRKDSGSLHLELMAARSALAQAHLENERLLEEIKKYNPLFQL
ncbi:bridge-like lipid transfer protein family member 3A isoform X2 [Pleurodeles waltl]|uniref:bridge-like lipid transfer protein family member 3A isoform X2 n=1 Tax=Pleurodeles waltl TaxID=8319 RepID=UPI0037093CD2